MNSKKSDAFIRLEPVFNNFIFMKTPREYI